MKILQYIKESLGFCNHKWECIHTCIVSNRSCENGTAAFFKCYKCNSFKSEVFKVAGLTKEIINRKI